MRLLRSELFRIRSVAWNSNVIFGSTNIDRRFNCLWSSFWWNIFIDSSVNTNRKKVFIRSLWHYAMFTHRQHDINWEHDPLQSDSFLSTLCDIGQTIQKKLSHSRGDWINTHHNEEIQTRTRRDRDAEMPKIVGSLDIDVIMRTRLEKIFILSYPQNSLEDMRFVYDRGTRGLNVAKWLFPLDKQYQMLSGF